MASPRDLYSFRRFLIVLLATVVAPVILLSIAGFLVVKSKPAAITRDALMAAGLIAVAVGVVITVRAYWINTRLARLQTDFVNNVSHELRTPLTSIRMFVETLQEGRTQDPKQVKECLDLLATETERLSNMIERMLSWARMEAGRRNYKLEPAEPAAIADAAVRAFKAQRLGAPYELIVEVPSSLPRVEADADAVAEALINLLSNAFKYSGDAKRIALRARTQGEWLVFEVEDNGIGISARDKKRVFDKFYRAEQLLSRKTEGTGLGLSMVRHIVEGHRGKIELDSEPGKGSRFRLMLRLPDAPAAARAPSANRERATT